MTFHSNSTDTKRPDQAQARPAGTAKANVNKAAETGARGTEAARDGINEAIDLQQANLHNAAELGTRATDAAREGISKTMDLQFQAAGSTKQFLQDGVEAVSHHAREASDRMIRTLGFSGESSDRLATQSKQNMAAVSRCGTVLTQALQDASRGWFELGQKQWQRNLDGLNKLARSTSLQEFAVVQSELVREGLQNMVQDSRAIAETALRAADEAGKSFTVVAPAQAPTQA